MKLYKDCTKESFSFLVNNSALPSDNSLRFRKNLLWNGCQFSNKLKTIKNKIEQNKTKYSLDKQVPKISGLSSRDVGKYEFLTGEDILKKKKTTRKIRKRFEYLLLGNELEKQIDIVGKQYRRLNNFFGFHIKEEDKKNIYNDDKRAAIKKNNKSIVNIVLTKIIILKKLTTFLLHQNIYFRQIFTVT